MREYEQNSLYGLQRHADYSCKISVDGLITNLENMKEFEIVGVADE